MYRFVSGGEDVCGGYRPRQVGVLVERLLDPVQEFGPDDAAAAPDGGHVTGLDAPVVFGAAGLNLVEALGIGDDLGGVQGLADVVDELRSVGWLLAELT